MLQIRSTKVLALFFYKFLSSRRFSWTQSDVDMECLREVIQIESVEPCPDFLGVLLAGGVWTAEHIWLDRDRWGVYGLRAFGL